MVKNYLLLLTTLFAIQTVQAQAPPNTEGEYEKQYQKRIKQESLNGVFIPKDLSGAFVQLNKLTDPGSRLKFKNMPEEFAATKLHFSLGRWITRNWGFYEGSRLSHYLKKLGLTHPDDMSHFVITSYHRYLNKKPLAVKQLSEKLILERKTAFELKKLDGTVIEIERRKRPKAAEEEGKN